MRGDAIRCAVAIAASAILLTAGAVGLSGQQVPRNGFWLEGGTGTGTIRSAGSAAERSEVTVAYGRSLHLRVGGAVSSRVLLGVELFTLDSDDLALQQGDPVVDAQNGSVGPVVLWYVGGSGLFLKGGVGVARGTFSARSATGQVISAKRTGSALSFDVGFDIDVARWLALTANLGTYILAIGDVSVEDASVDDLVATVYEAGIGLTLR